MQEQDFIEIRKFCAKLLKRKFFSKAKIKEKLLSQGFNFELVDNTINYLQTQDLINDQRLAQMFVYSSLQRNWGIKKITDDLESLGIEDKFCKQALEINSSVYKEKLIELIKDRYKLYLKYKDKYCRVINYLLNRGFNEEEIIETMRSLGYNHQDLEE